MTQAFERLVEARISAGYPDASQAARAMNVALPTYLGHENGSRGLSRSAQRYATFFRVSLEWLLTGRGSMKAAHPTAIRAIPVVGLVGAGASILPIADDSAGDGHLDQIELPNNEYLAALEIRGDSQYPRYLDGEYILYDSRPEGPGRLVNNYAVVETVDGRRLLKMLRRMPQPGRFRLESHNAPPEDNTEIVAAYRVKGTLGR